MDKYPSSMSVNFKKLDKVALSRILKYYNVEVKDTARQSELAIIVAKIFESVPVVENEVIDKIALNFCHAAADNAAPSVLKKRPLQSAFVSGGISYRDQYSERDPAVPGEQVAAKVSKSGEDGSWILGNVLDFDVKNQTYLVQDEDDVNRIMSLPQSDVRRLDDVSTHLRRGDSVLAVFPETTSFYAAVVYKAPKAMAHSGPGAGANSDVVVKFEDDEDESGKNPARRVPARFVLLRRDLEENDDSEEED